MQATTTECYKLALYIYIKLYMYIYVYFIPRTVAETESSDGRNYGREERQG